MRLFLLTAVASLPILFSLPSCDQAGSVGEKIRGSLERDTEPSQVVGLPENQKNSATEVPPPPEPVKMGPVIDKGAQVSVLGYHRFTDSRSPTDMIINIDDFRSQMKAIAESKIPVISMKEFLAWKRGEANIPPESILITIDDGWKSTHSLALPVLKEFDFPFTVFVYKDYVNIGGSSMTYKEIEELIEGGGTICSHSVSHSFMNRKSGRSQKDYDAWLEMELNDSHDFLIEKFNSDGILKTFAYPYGAYNDHVVKFVKDTGYDLGFTVSPGKAKWSTPNLEINRYIIHGNNGKTFDRAIAFSSNSGATGSSAAGRTLLTGQRDKETGEMKAPLVTVYPPNQSVVKNRLPRIEVDLSNLSNFQPESISMRITGLGKVPHKYNSQTKIAYYQVPQRLRLESYSSQISFKKYGASKHEVIGWQFKIDHKAEYLDPNSTFIRPVDEPVDPTEDLVLPELEEEQKIASDESEETSTQATSDSPQKISLPPISPSADL